MRNLLISFSFVTFLLSPSSLAAILDNYALTPMVREICEGHVAEITAAFQRRTNVSVMGDCYNRNGQDYLRIKTSDNQPFATPGALASGLSSSYTRTELVSVQVSRSDYRLSDTDDVIAVNYTATILRKVPVQGNFGADAARCESALNSTLGGSESISVGGGYQNPFAGYCYLNGSGEYVAQLLFTEIRP